MSTENQILFNSGLLVLLSLPSLWMTNGGAEEALVAALFIGFAIIQYWIGSKRPWSTASIFAVVGLLSAFGPHWLRNGAVFSIGIPTEPFITGHLNPILYLSGLYLLVAGIRLRPKFLATRGRMVQSILFSVGPILLASCFGIYSHGIHWDAGKIVAWQTAFNAGWVTAGDYALLLSLHAVIVAIIEESLFRGLLLPAAYVFSKRWVSANETVAILIALVLSSFLFGLAHFHAGSNWMIGASIAGIGYGVAYIRGSSIAVAIAIHAVMVLLLAAVLHA